MSEQTITTIGYDECQSLIDAYIEPSSHEFGEMPASVFFELLFERIAKDMPTSSDPQNPNSPKPQTSR